MRGSVQYYASRSSLAPSTTLTTSDSNVSTTDSRSHRPSGELFSLLHSRDKARGQHRAQVDDRQEKSRFEKYAHHLRSRINRHFDHIDMLEPARHEIETNGKRDYKLSDFLNRSLSRTRTKNGRAHSPVAIILDSPPRVQREARSAKPQITTVGQSNSRPKVNPNRSDGTLSGQAIISQSVDRAISKPRSRIPSRPLSSTTITSHSTVTPHLRPKKPINPISPVPSPSERSHPTLEQTEEPIATPPSPKTCGARKKLHAIFGIPLSSPRKSSFSLPRSGTSTPKPTAHPTPLSEPDDEDVFSSPQAPISPVLHTALTEHDNVSRPTTPSRTLKRDVAPNGIPTSKLDLWLSPRYFTNRNDPSIDAHFTGNGSVVPVARSRALSPNNKKQLTEEPIPAQAACSQSRSPTLQSPQPRPVGAVFSPSIPTIKHTPPTPARSKATTPAPWAEAAAPSEADISTVPRPHSRIRQIADELNSCKSCTSSADGHGQSRSRSPSQSREHHPSSKFFSRDNPSETKLTPARVGSPILRGTEHREHRMERSNSGSGNLMKKVRRITHGSFDFERPISHAANGHGNRSRANSVSVEDRTGSEGSKRSTEKNGSSKKPTLQRHVEVTEDPIPTVARPSGFKALTSPTRRQRTIPSHKKSNSASDTLPVAGTSKRPDGIITAAQSSSVGRSGSRVHTTHLAHPLFAFESAAPQAACPNPQSEFGTLPRATKALGEAKDGQDHDRQGRGRGRKLELGLSLLWAPTRMKEEALLPSSIGRPDRRWLHTEKDEEEHRKRIGSGVTEVFRDILGERGFASFKKYIRRFDANAMPLEGPTGLIVRVKKLLDAAPSQLEERVKLELLENFVEVIRAA